MHTLSACVARTRRRCADPLAEHPGGVRQPRARAPGPGGGVRVRDRSLLHPHDTADRGQSGARHPAGRDRHDVRDHRGGHRPVRRFNPRPLRCGARRGAGRLEAAARSRPGRRTGDRRRMRSAQRGPRDGLDTPFVHRHARDARDRAGQRVPGHRLADQVHRRGRGGRRSTGDRRTDHAVPAGARGRGGRAVRR